MGMLVVCGNGYSGRPLIFSLLEEELVDNLSPFGQTSIKKLFQLKKKGEMKMSRILLTVDGSSSAVRAA